MVQQSLRVHYTRGVCAASDRKSRPGECITHDVEWIHVVGECTGEPKRAHKHTPHRELPSKLMTAATMSDWPARACHRRATQLE